MENLYQRIDELSFDEFEKLLDFIEKSRKKRVQKILDEAQKRAARLNVELSAVNGKGRKSSAKRKAKYRHPEHDEKTWSGIGRQPVWFREYLEQGGNADDLLLP